MKYLVALLLSCSTIISHAQTTGNVRNSYYSGGQWNTGTWTGSGVAGVNSSGVPATLAISGSANGIAPGDLAPQIQSSGVIPSRFSTSPRTLAKIYTGTAPIRILNGPSDSLGGNFSVNDPAARSGWIKNASSGVFTGSSGPNTTVTGTSNYNIWPTGEYAIIRPNDSGTFTFSNFAGQAGASFGSQIIAGYVSRPGGTTFALRWIDLGGTFSGSMVLTATSSAIVGTATTATLTVGSLPPTYQAVVTNTGTSDLELIAIGIYNTNGGGAISIDGVMQRGGASPSTLVTTSTAIFNPIMSALSPDLITSVYDDEASYYLPGGEYDQFYDRMQSIDSTIDWIIIAAPPGQDPLVEQKYAEARIAQYNFAVRRNQTYFDTVSVFGGSWTAANEMGLMADAIHPNSGGYSVWRARLWGSTDIGNIPMGRVPFTYQAGSPGINQSGGVSLTLRASGDPSSLKILSTNPIIIPGLNIVPFPLDLNGIPSTAGLISFVNPGNMQINNQLEVVGTGGPRVVPLTDNSVPLGNSSRRWSSGFFAGGFRVGSSTTSATISGIYTGTTTMSISGLAAGSVATQLIPVSGATTTNTPMVTISVSGTLPAGMLQQGAPYLVASGTAAVDFYNATALPVTANTQIIRADVIQY